MNCPTRPALALLAVLAAACGPSPEPAARPGPDAPAEERWAALVSYGAVPLEGVLTGGQPSPEQLEELAAEGFRTVVNLRQESERGVKGEAARVEGLGMRYVSIPVDGKAGLTRAKAEELDRVLAEADRPLLLHCGSSNRVGALLALRAAELEGASPQEALEIGRSAGLTRLEPAVRELLRAKE